MNLKEKMDNFRKRWKIVGKTDPALEFKKFKTRIINIIEDVDNHIPDNGIDLFCNFIGIKRTPKEGSYHNPGDVYYAFERENDPINFYRLLELLFGLPMYTETGYSHEVEFSKEKLAREVAEAISFSDIDLAMAKNGGDFIFYPKGEEMLDEQLVNQPLSFLSGGSNKHFVDALGFYSEKKWVKCAESLRRCTEEFLRLKLGNSGGLAANIVEMGKKLKNEKAPAQARNIIFQNLNTLDQFFNDESKHNDGDLNEEDAEFLIYQTGLILRFIEKHVR